MAAISTSNTAYPTVATIIGCPEQLSSTKGLVATPIGASGELQPPAGPYLEDTSLIKDPIRKALIDNICVKSDYIRCDVCKVDCNGAVAYQSHLSGSRHSKRLKEKVMTDFVKLPFIRHHVDSNSYSCTLCCATLNAISQISAHIEGQKHKNKVQSNEPLEDSNKKINSDPAKPRVDATPNLLYCATCNILVNSQQQLEQHTLSRKHINRVNGRSRPGGPYWKWKSRNAAAGRASVLTGEGRISSVSSVFPKLASNFISSGQFRPY